MEITNINSFLEYYEKIRARTTRVISSIPQDRLEWTYKEGKFTFGDIIRHLAAIERFMYAETVQMLPSRYPGHGQELANGYEETMRYFNAMHQESVAIFAQLTSEQLFQKCETPAGNKITIWKWLRAMVEHEIHHRAQIFIYLGMIGEQSSPLYGLTAEEVKQNSQP